MLPLWQSWAATPSGPDPEILGAWRRARRLLGLDPARQLVAVKRQEVDGFKVDRDKATIPRDVADDAAQKGEGDPRAFDQQVGVHLLFWDTFDVEHTGVLDLEEKDCFARSLGL